MAEQSKAEKLAKPSEHVSAKPPEPVLAKASESGDGAVQQLLAQREIHLANGDNARATDVDRQLAQLGYTV